ncbi:hypothetical protein PAL_GLEAN10011086 [Pteropus alecto]|uniref:Uncharacterized protein n=1 Tax=Pteropus alecto TaxID=9402 RepID=L5KW79_PTEAL|nr:hypothetical protein PAL_GLEAN10011086 [Pteropus alecto]
MGLKVKDSRSALLLQSEGTKAGRLGSSEEAVAGPCSPFRPHCGSPGAICSPPAFAHAVPNDGYALPMADLKDIDTDGYGWVVVTAE